MNGVAICVGSLVIYWSAIVIALAIAVCFGLTYSLYTANGGNKAALWTMLPVAVILGVVLSRAVHWYCHSEQYAGFLSAVTDYSAGGYCLPGAFLGVILAVLLVKALRLTDSAGKLFDCLAPGAALGLAVLRLSALFNESCRGKIIVRDPDLQRLPLASPITTASGELEYHLATFFIEFMVLLVLFVIVMCLFSKRRNHPMKGNAPARGNVALLFLGFYGALQVILDSTRYDSSFLPANGFISLVQIVGAVFIVGVMVYYTVWSAKTNGFMPKQIVLWVIFLAAVGGTGYLEYLVQRHGDWYLKCYGMMSLTVLVMCIVVYCMYRSVCLPKAEASQQQAEPEMAAAV